MSMNKKVIKKIRENTIIAEDILFKIFKFVNIGVTTYELNQIAEQEFKKNKGLPSAKFLGLPLSVSVAINNEVLFGKITKDRKIEDGDIVKLALGIFKDGYFSDLGLTVIVGTTTKENKKLIIGTAEALMEAVKKLSVGISVKEISTTIEDTLRNYDLNPICEITGHGIGRNLHEPPAIPNCKNLSFIDYDYKFRIGDIVCIEPIATTGTGEVLKKNKITFITKDKTPSAHFELPILIKKDGVEILGRRTFEHLKSLQISF